MNHFLKKLSLCLLFFILTPLTVVFSFYFFDIDKAKVLGTSVAPLASAGNNVYLALPEETGLIASSIQSQAATRIIIQNYLRRYNSPLLDYVDVIIEKGNLYGVKPQLLVAIAQQESNLGKNSPPDCFNAWGWDIHKKGTKCFSNWQEAIETVAEGIGRLYCQKGLCNDPCLMMKKYTPSSNGSWCFGINKFLNELETGNY